MYLHAERLLAKAGRQGARGGESPILWSGGEAGAERTKCSGGLHKRSAEDCGKPLVPRQGRALSKGLVSASCALGAHYLSGLCGVSPARLGSRKTRPVGSRRRRLEFPQKRGNGQLRNLVSTALELAGNPTLRALRIPNLPLSVRFGTTPSFGEAVFYDSFICSRVVTPDP